MDGTVLVADDDRTIRTVLTQALTRAGCRVHATSSMVTLMRWVEEGRGDAVISDVVMPDGNGLEALPEIAKLRPDLPVIVISAQNTIMTTIKATEAEAFDYLPKPFDLPDLMKRCARALDKKRLRSPAPTQEQSAPKNDQAELPLVGQTAVMQDLYRLVARVLNVDLSVLITGESGTGKSLIAKALHDYSDRADAPFVVVGPDDLVSATSLQDIMRRAENGTVLFEGVSDLDSDAQARLTRVLDGQDHKARILAISQGDLAHKAAIGAFREDLFYRLAGMVLPVPPLRDRLEDIPVLCTHFLNRLSHAGQAKRRFSADAVESLVSFSWPGNLRQLENLVSRLSITCTEDEINKNDVETALQGAKVHPVQTGDFANERLSDSIARHLQRYFDMHSGSLPPAGLYQRILHEVELPLLEITLDATGGNQAKSADLLGINRNTLRKKIAELEIEVTRRRKLM
jgi:two-component system nitrogen regulation response regulator GlnG